MRIQLEARAGRRPPLSADLTKSSVTLGSGAGSDFVVAGDGLDFSHVAAQHARIDLSPQGATLTDLGSDKGTWINGQAVTLPAALRTGMRFSLGRLGPTVTVVGLDLTPPPAPRPTGSTSGRSRWIGAAIAAAVLLAVLGGGSMVLQKPADEAPGPAASPAVADGSSAADSDNAATSDADRPPTPSPGTPPGDSAPGDSAPATPPSRPASNAASSPVQVPLVEPLQSEAPVGNAGMFVGVGRFTEDDSWVQLRFAPHDAIELAHLFVHELKLIPAGNCHLLLSGDPTAAAVQAHLEALRQAGAQITGASRSEILKSLRQIAGAAEADHQMLVCAFCSHGVELESDPFVIPSDGIRGQLIKETAVPIRTVEQFLEESRAGHRLLLVDACQERVTARGAGSAGQPASEAFAKALQTPTGQAKLASCSPGELSWEHDSLGGVGHGLFTWQFLQALRGGASAGAGEIVTLDDVAKSVSAGVGEWTLKSQRSKQTPFLVAPIEAHRMPLAQRAGDLQTLISAIGQRPAEGEFTAELRAALMEHLRTITSSPPSDPADVALISHARDFTGGRLSPVLFVPFLARDRSRWRTPGDAPR